MKFKFSSYANIRSICDKLGNSVCRFLPHFHSITGRDTTSYFYNVGKRNPFNKVLSHPEHLELLISFGLEQKLPEQGVDDCMGFIQVLLYACNRNETYVEARVRLFRKQRKKTSMLLSPDEKSTLLYGKMDLTNFA